MEKLILSFSLKIKKAPSIMNIKIFKFIISDPNIIDSGRKAKIILREVF